MRALIAVVVLLSATLLLSFRAFDGSTRVLRPDDPAVAASPGSSAATLATDPQDIPVTGSVRVVSGPETTLPVPRARVRIRGTAISKTTDASGAFDFTLPPGDYTASVRVPGYLCRAEQFTVRSGVLPPPVVITCGDRLPPSPDTVVYISVDTITGIVSVTPDPLYVAPNDCIAWTSSAGPWAVHFSPISPITHRRIRAAADSTVVGCVRSDVFPGKYSYFVAVAVGDSVYTEDPELIDENEDG